MNVPKNPAIAGGARAEVERIADALQARRGDIADAMVAAIQAEIRPYGRASGTDLDADVLAHCDAHAKLLLEVSREGREPTREELGFAREAAVRRVRQGVPLDALLQAFRVGHRTVWDAILEEAADSPTGMEAAVTLARPAMEYIDVASTQVAETYLQERQRLVATADRERRDLLENLLAGTPAVVNANTPQSAAPGLDPQGDLIVLVARLDTGAERGPGREVGSRDVPAGDRPGGNEVAESWDRAAALEHAAEVVARAGTAGEPLVVVRQLEIVGVCAASDATVLSADLARACETLAASGTNVHVGLSGALRGFGEIGRGYHEAHEALRHATGASPVVVLQDVSAFDYLVGSVGPAGQRVISERGRALLEVDAREHGAIIDTLLAYVESNLNANRAAERLVVHPNTVRYRLGRIAELTGQDPRTFVGLLELLTVIRVTRRRWPEARGPLGGDQAAAAGARSTATISSSISRRSAIRSLP